MELTNTCVWAWRRVWSWPLWIPCFVIETHARFLFCQKEGLDIERHDRDIKNSSHSWVMRKTLVPLCLFFHYLGQMRCGWGAIRERPISSTPHWFVSRKLLNGRQGMRGRWQGMRGRSNVSSFRLWVLLFDCEFRCAGFQEGLSRPFSVCSYIGENFLRDVKKRYFR